MKKALCVGIDYYKQINDLFGCVADAVYFAKNRPSYR